MQDAKLTVRVPRELLDNLKRYADRNNTTLSELIKAYIRRIPAQDATQDAPIVRRLTGLLSGDVSEDDYRQHLEDKYGK